MAAPTTPTTPPARPATGSAVLVVLVLAAITLTVVIGLGFSTNNTRFSVDGTTATTSHLLDDE